MMNKYTFIIRMTKYMEPSKLAIICVLSLLILFLSPNAELMVAGAVFLFIITVATIYSLSNKERIMRECVIHARQEFRYMIIDELKKK